MTLRIDTTGMYVTRPEPWPERDLDTPPSDAKAECALLAMCEIYPDQIGALRLNGLLIFPEHRQIWQAMCQVHNRSPGLDVAEFYLALRVEMCAELCKDGAGHERDREHCQGWRTLRVLDFGEHANPFKDIPYWLARLERVRDSRRLIDLAQTAAERAWRMDVEGAQAAGVQMVGVRHAPPVWKRAGG